MALTAKRFAASVSRHASSSRNAASYSSLCTGTNEGTNEDRVVVDVGVMLYCCVTLCQPRGATLQRTHLRSADPQTPSKCACNANSFLDASDSTSPCERDVHAYACAVEAVVA